MSEARKPGIQVRREVMGDAFVDRALGNATAFTQPLQEFVNEHAWGGVWNREGLDRKTRSLITLAALTALKCPQELKGHVRGALNNGCSVEEIREALLHCAVYAGVPAAIDAFRAAQEIIDDYQKA
ncbi:carboxymuconolactone decarboxylase family protein [Metapseudomonas furukawaii]|jgi:4-carboxymuconolactone decarboxylase|uniref:carboxymuconolactone decarboxylase family protein n=1 Tax=Metapseudomonas furukawaii TaxID=1149133 RepID=UPI000B49E338|nr:MULTISPECIES: carboxymuconolactone decarboxylase family protein [Pseudomonas]OWJ94118.1 4-carboxymuconolactone decarboxylase [Pseudomonas sp. A46]WAG80003.1 carboxymuconolactone decarboxylase family protein [Pseudomonas furukawaii]